MITGATLELNLADFNTRNGIEIDSLLFDKVGRGVRRPPSPAAATATATIPARVAAARSTMKNPADWVILPELISKEPLGIHARDGDERWNQILRWTHYALLTAEEFGVTQANVDEHEDSRQRPLRPPPARHRGRFRQAARARRRVGLPGDQGRAATTASSTTATSARKALGLPRGLNNL